MKHSLQRFAPTFFVLLGFLLSGQVADSLVLGVKLAARDDPPMFFVKLDTEKKAFYFDEHISFGIAKRADRREDVSRSSTCSFGGGGSRFQVVRKGEVVKESNLAPMSRLAVSEILGVTYHGFGAGTSPSQFVPESDVDVKDSYQIRAVCGNEVSAPSEPFHVEPWREPVDGLQVRLRPLKSTYQVGEPILVEATMRNVGRKPRLCPVPSSEDGYMRAFWRFHATNNLRDPRPLLDDLYARRLKLLRPGESRTATIALTNLQAIDEKGATKFGSRAGKYVVSATVYFHDDPPRKYAANLWRGEMASNAFEIVVR